VRRASRSWACTAALCTAALWLQGCVTLSGAQLSATAAADLESAPLCCPAGLAQAPVQPLPDTPKEPEAITIDAKRPAHVFGGGKGFFVLLALPPFEAPYSIEFTSDAAGPLHNSAIFVPLITTFDADFKAVRQFGEDGLRQRGQQVERTIFVNPSNRQERYLAVYGKGTPSTASTQYAVINSSPVVAGPVMFNVISGSDIKGIRSTAATGTVRVKVKRTAQP
jgi:hypothetical protein